MMPSQEQTQLPAIERIERALVRLASFIELDRDVHEVRSRAVRIEEEGRYEGSRSQALDVLRRLGRLERNPLKKF
jgi:hypothetical protein